MSSLNYIVRNTRKLSKANEKVMNVEQKESFVNLIIINSSVADDINKCTSQRKAFKILKENNGRQEIVHLNAILNNSGCVKKVEGHIQKIYLEAVGKFIGCPEEYPSSGINDHSADMSNEYILSSILCPFCDSSNIWKVSYQIIFAAKVIGFRD
ncbi:hypothetical protein CDAR_209071 [Caerostris darwini]|uniref:Uncharacterized protein n=1 Tax=Caerostris darwini TaxID=1538125 RepID=A0AAV4WRE3_9ARAC|nr:hypothetical protein CDAR_209071 [Caerostris darwini]